MKSEFKIISDKCMTTCSLFFLSPHLLKIPTKKMREKKKWGGSPDSEQRQDQLSPMVSGDRVNCLCPKSAVLSELVEEEKGSFKAGSNFSLDSTHAYTHPHTHTYCPNVSAAVDWGLTIHRKVNKLLSVLCRGINCPLAYNPYILHITHSIQHTSFLTVSPSYSYSWSSVRKKEEMLISLVSLMAYADCA